MDVGLIALGCGVLGLLMGSFANVCIHRIPLEIPLGFWGRHARSACPQCEARIAWYDNVPLLSYALLKGRCRKCSKPISPRYPLVEILLALLWALTGGLFAAASGSLDLEPARFWALLAVQLYFTFALLVTTFIDLDHRIIPDRFSLGGWGLALLASVTLGYPFWLSSLVGGLLGFGMFFFHGLGLRKMEGH